MDRFRLTGGLGILVVAAMVGGGATSLLVGVVDPPTEPPLTDATVATLGFLLVVVGVLAWLGWSNARVRSNPYW